MEKISHRRQQKIWDKEHKEPFVLKQMDSSEPSSGVLPFLDFLKEQKHSLVGLKGIEMGCGKGRNVNLLSSQQIEMVGFDFSPAAIKEAKKRAKKLGVLPKLMVLDATSKWSFEANTFDFAIDCFATTDIESKKGRKFAVSEMKRVVKPGGYILTYVMSEESEYHREMILESPASEQNAFLHPLTGKFEKAFDRKELLDLYSGLIVIEEKRISKTEQFFGKEYACRNHWIVFQKPK